MNDMKVYTAYMNDITKEYWKNEGLTADQIGDTENKERLIFVVCKYSKCISVWKNDNILIKQITGEHKYKLLYNILKTVGFEHQNS